MREATIFDPFGTGAAIGAALRTGLLEEIAKGPATARELSDRLGLDLRATSLVLDLLQASQLVRRTGERIEAGDALASADRFPGGQSTILGLWAHTEQFLRTGEPFMTMDRGPAEREVAYRDVVGSLATFFEEPARELAAGLSLRPKRILDVGCGSGVWSFAIAAKGEGVRVTGLDLPAVLESFRARAAALSIADRVTTIAGDMHEVEIPAGAFDLVVIANVLRIDTPARARSVVERIATAVAPGGAVLVVDALANGTPERERARALYALNLGLRTRSAQVHAPATITEWLASTGLDRVTSIEISNGAAGLGALLATRTDTKEEGR